MIERIKTVLLVLLVLCSFYLTYLLWWDNPTYETLEPEEYQEPTYIGKQSDWKDRLRPNAIYFHYADNRHTKATPEMSVYKILWESLQKWRFTQPQIIELSRDEGQAILEQHNGLEYVFADDLPVSFYEDFIELPLGFSLQIDTFNRLWIYEAEAGEYAALFISDDDRTVVRTNFIDSDNNLNVRNLILLGSQLGEVQPAQYASAVSETIGIHIDFFNIIYLPVDRGLMSQWTYEASTIDIQDMIRALFIDVSAIKEIPERGNSLIITDGTKSLQYKQSENEMRFYLPTYNQGLNVLEQSTYYYILDFLNDHHGWTGDFYVDQWMVEPDSRGIQFRESIYGYPIYGDESYPYIGQIVVKYEANQVNEYARGLLQLVNSYRGYQVQILSGEELLEILREQYIYMYNIESITLGYKAVFHPETMEVELIPHYVIEFTNGAKPMYVDARAQQLEG